MIFPLDVYSKEIALLFHIDLVHRSKRGAYWNTSDDKSVIRRPHPSLFHSASDLSWDVFIESRLISCRDGTSFRCQTRSSLLIIDSATTLRFTTHAACPISIRSVVSSETIHFGAHTPHSHDAGDDEEITRVDSRSVEMNEISRRSKFNFRLG